MTPAPITYLPPMPRVLPQSPDTEQAILGTLLIAPELVPECIERLTSDHFSVPAHVTIYETIVRLWKESRPANFVTLTQALQNTGELAAVGGATFVTDLCAGASQGAAVLAHYIDILREKWVARQVILHCTEAAAAGYDGADDPRETALRVIDKLTATLEHGTEHDPDERTMHDRVVDFQKHVEDLYDRGAAVTGLPFGLSRFDDHTGGMQPGELWVICGHTKSGKTSLGMQALTTCLLSGIPCSLISLEMTTRQLVGRIISWIGQINGSCFRRPRLMTEGEFAKFSHGSDLVQDLPLRIHERKRSISRIAAAIERDVRKFGVQLACIDYTQLVDGECGRGENREREVARVSSAAKALAVRHNIPILLLSQTNDDGKLRESRAIGQDADAVIKVCVPVREGSKPPEPDLASDRRIIVIEYARSFAAERFEVRFVNSQTRFEDSL